MPASVIIGTQWGDEGKGKVVDLLAADADVVVRFHGGNNAGHTLVVNGEKTILNLVPAGVLHPGRICMLGPGVVIDGSATVFINGLPACRQGDTVIEALGPPNKIAMGMPTVQIGP